MAKKDMGLTQVGNSGVARAGRIPGAQSQAARSEFDAINNPLQGGMGYDATLAGNIPVASGVAKRLVPARARKNCLPGTNQASDYRSDDKSFRVRRARKPRADRNRP